MLRTFLTINVALLAIWCSVVDWRDLVRMFVTNDLPAGAPVPDFGCMVTRCGAVTVRCITDRMCLKALACVGPCGDDQACTFHCISNYETPLFHEFNKCLIHDQKCLELKTPETPHVCGDPETVSALTPASDIFGRWFIALGFNPVYDCFPCQIFTFKEIDGQLVVYMDYQVELSDSGDIVDKTVIESIHQLDPSRPGLLLLNGTQNGLYHEEDWRILGLTPEMLVAQYCGSMTSWVYEGAVVLIRGTELTTRLEAEAEKMLKKVGFSISDFCRPRIEQCSNEEIRL